MEEKTMKNRILITLIAILCAVLLLVPIRVHADGKEGGTLTCTTSNNQVWNINGTYSKFDMAPEVDMYRGSTFVQHFFPTNGYVQISLQVAAQTANQVYSLYDGTSTSAPLLIQTSCTAKTVAAASAPKTTTTTTTTSNNAAAPATATSPAPGSSAVASPTSATTVDTTPSTDTNLNALNANNQQQSNKLTAPLLAALIVLGFLALLTIVSVWITFKKAGRPGWGSIVPIYSGWLQFEMGGRPGWWALVMLIPFINFVAIVMLILADIEIAKRFGKSGLFGFFGLFLIPIIGWPILAFSRARFNNPASPALSQTMPPADSPQPPSANITG
jgi:hypothetical protein